MRYRLLALTAALGMAALATWTPSAEAIPITPYCSDTFCAEKPEDTACTCPPGTDKEGKRSNCEVWNSIAGGGCWYF